MFYAGLRRATGTILFQSLGGHYRNHQQKLEWLGKVPFSFEGSRSAAHAKRAIHSLSDLACEPGYFPLNEIRNCFGNLSLQSAYEKADELMVEQLNCKGGLKS